MRWALLATLIAATIGWQAALQQRGHTLDPTHRLGAATGLCYAPWARLFTTYYFYDAFPVAFRPPPRRMPTTQAEAQRLLAWRGGDLVTADGSHCAVGRVGDYGKLWLFWPAAWIKGGPQAPTIQPAKTALFVLALVAVLVAFARERRLGLGVLVVVLVGSHPFLLYESYGRENVFSLPIAMTLLVLALHLRLLRARVTPAWSDWAAAATSGVLLGFAREIRTEAALPLLAVLAACLAASGLAWRRRAALAAVALACFVAAGAAWNAYCGTLFANADRLARAHGGNPYEGPRSAHHPVWHAIWCGLGDFAEDRGYVFSDGVAYAYALPILNAEHGYDFSYDQGVYLDQSYDEAGAYRILPLHVPEYTDVLRRKVLSDVAASPGWAASILLRRTARIFGDAPPVDVHLAVARLRIPWSGWLLLPVLAVVWLRGETFLAKVLLFSLPLALLPLVVTTYGGTTGYAIFPHLAAAVALAELGRAAAPHLRRRLAGGPPDADAPADGASTGASGSGRRAAG